MSNQLLGGKVDTLSQRDSLSPLAKLGNVYGPGGGFQKSPLAGAQLNYGTLNLLNLPKNDVVDPLDQVPERLAPVVLPTASIIAVTVAELTVADNPTVSGSTSSSSTPTTPTVDTPQDTGGGAGGEGGDGPGDGGAF